MLIYEPCNYASNIAYYHAATKVCEYGDNWSIPEDYQKTLKRLFATQGSQSAFFHGSFTNVGHVYDVQLTSLIAVYGLHIQNLGLKSNSSMLNQLSPTPRNQTIHEIVDTMTVTLAEKNASTWRQVLDEADYEHDFIRVFSAIIANVVNLVFGPSLTTLILDQAADILMNSSRKDFLMNQYLPELFATTNSVVVPTSEKLALTSMGLGVLLKQVYAFLYQEKKLPKKVNAFFDQPWMIRLGGHMIPAVYWIVDSMTGFKQTDKHVNYSYDLYPGQSYCKMHQAHSVWHEVEANAFLDLIYLCDHTNKLVQRYNQEM